METQASRTLKSHMHNGRFEVVPSETLQVQELRRAVLDIIGEADHGNL